MVSNNRKDILRVSFENLITGVPLDENNCGGNSWLKEVGHRTLWKYDAVVVCAHTQRFGRISKP